MGLAGPRNDRGALVGVAVGWPPGEEGFRASAATEDRVSGGPLRLLQAPSADGLFRRTSQVRLNPPGYSGLRGEGSIPVPLPPPGCSRSCVLRAIRTSK
jgi:hypothetical protein